MKNLSDSSSTLAEMIYSFSCGQRHTVIIVSLYKKEWEISVLFPTFQSNSNVTLDFFESKPPFTPVLDPISFFFRGWTLLAEG